jgi:outer membrane protein
MNRSARRRACRGCLVVAAAFAGAAAAVGGEIGPAEIVEAAVRHSPALRAADRERAAAQAARGEAAAATRPAVDAELRATHFEGVEDMTFGPALTAPAIEDRYGASIGLSWPLYAGGALSARRRAAEAGTVAAALGARERREAAAFQAWVAYWAWSKAREAVEVSRAWVRWIEEHEKDMERLKQAGLALESDALATTVRLERTRLALEDALRRERLLRAEIAWRIGRDLPAEAAPRTPTSSESPLEPEEESLRVALGGRPEPSRWRAARQAAEERVRVERAGRRPKAWLSARYEMARPNMQNLPPADEWDDDAFVGVVARWDLWDWGLTGARVAGAEARAEQAEIERLAAHEAIVLDVRRARIGLESAWARERLARRAEASARRNLKSATDSWRGGLARHADVLDAQARVAEAEYEGRAAMADALIARGELAFAKGRFAESLDARVETPAGAAADGGAAAKP